MDFSQESQGKVKKKSKKLTFPWLFLTKIHFFLTVTDFLFYRGWRIRRRKHKMEQCWWHPAGHDHDHTEGRGLLGWQQPQSSCVDCMWKGTSWKWERVQWSTQEHWCSEEPMAKGTSWSHLWTICTYLTIYSSNMNMTFSRSSAALGIWLGQGNAMFQGK